jgi:hypothetical protein
MIVSEIGPMLLYMSGHHAMMSFLLRVTGTMILGKETAKSGQLKYGLLWDLCEMNFLNLKNSRDLSSWVGVNFLLFPEFACFFQHVSINFLVSCAITVPINQKKL